MTQEQINEIFEFVKSQMSIVDKSVEPALKNSVLGAISILQKNGISDNQILSFAGKVAVKFIADGTWQVSGSNIPADIQWYISRLRGETLVESQTNCDVCNCKNGNQNDHSKLVNLEFEKSGHKGFASSEDISVSNLLFMAIENNNPVLTAQMPTTNQVLLPMRWFATEPETWQDILTLTSSDSIGSQFFEIIQGNRFSAKLFLNSDVARTDARVRLQLIDITDNEVLGTATQIVDFPSMNVINVPISFEGFYQSLRRVQLSNIRLVISVMTSLFGFQIRLISNPPNEISFMSKTSTTALTEEQIRDMTYNVFGR